MRAAKGIEEFIIYDFEARAAAAQCESENNATENVKNRTIPSSISSMLSDDMALIVRPLVVCARILIDAEVGSIDTKNAREGKKWRRKKNVDTMR